jgi:hypothetical protein
MSRKRLRSGDSPAWVRRRSTGTALNLVVHLCLVIVIKAERGMDLRQRQMGMLKVDFLWTPSVGDHIHGNLDDFGVRVVDPRDATVIEPNMGGSTGSKRAL